MLNPEDSEDYETQEQYIRLGSNGCRDSMGWSDLLL